MSDQWQVEPSGPGMLGRLLVPQSSTKPAVTAFLVGLAGAGAFVASMVLDWQRITIPQDPSSSSSSSRSSAPDEFVLTAGLGSIDVLGLVYLLGGLGLITILGSVLVRPESALRLRMGAAGLGVGIVGVLIATALRLKETILNLQGMFGGISSQGQQEIMDGSDRRLRAGALRRLRGRGTARLPRSGSPVRRRPEPPLGGPNFVADYPAYAAYHSAQNHAGNMYPTTAVPNGSVAPAQTSHGATPPGQPVVVPAGSVPTPTPAYPPPAVPYAPAPPTPPYPTPPPAPGPQYAPQPGPQYAPPPGPQTAPTPASVYTPPPPSTWSRAGHVDELTVTPSEPLDPGTNPDVWRS